MRELIILANGKDSMAVELRYSPGFGTSVALLLGWVRNEEAGAEDNSKALYPLSFYLWFQ